MVDRPSSLSEGESEGMGRKRVRDFRRKWHALRVVFGLIAAVLCSVPEMRAPLGVPMETSLGEQHRNPNGGIPLGSLLRAAEEREEAADDAPVWGRRLIQNLGRGDMALGQSALVTQPARHSGSHFPTGPPLA
jgi:hypothetical protein